MKPSKELFQKARELQNVGDSRREQGEEAGGQYILGKVDVYFEWAGEQELMEKKAKK